MQRKENVNDTLKAVLQKHWTMLIQAVRQLAQAVGNRPPESEEVAAFFHDFMDGYWDVFEETTAHSKEELKQADRQSQMLQDQILQQLGSEHRELLDKYETLLYNRTSTELEMAFLVGSQTAIRFLLMGILPLQAFSRDSDGDDQNERSNEQK